MSRRSAVEQIVIEEKTVGDAINKLVGAREKASAWHLKWAKFEGQEFLIFLFSKLAELRWIWNEIARQFSDKHQDYLKTFKDIYHEERVIEDTKKALQACEASITKLRKQIETAQKKSDSVKLHSLDCEINSQLDMKEFLMRKIEDHSDKMNRTKIEQVQKGLLLQAQSGIQLADQLKHMFIAQLRIADALGSYSTDDGATWQKITQSLIGLSDTLGLYPPPSGAVDPLPSPSESPHLQRKSTVESPLISPIPPPLSSAPQTPTARKSFPFPNRPLPQEPSYDTEPPRHPPPPPPHSQSFSSGMHTLNHTPNHTPTHGYKGKFYRCSSDLTPRTNTRAIPSQTLSHPHHPQRASFMILEESDPFIEPRTRSQSVGQSVKRKSSDSPSHSILNMGSSSENLHGSKQIPHQNSDSSLSSYNDTPTHGYDKAKQTDTLGSWSDSGYADPIDALKSYYNLSGHQGGVVNESPYQSLSEIQRVRRLQLERIEQSQNDPTYSRPFDSLVGLREPVKIKGEGRPGIPVALKSINTPPDFIPARSAKMGMKKKNHHRMRQLTQRSSGSDETLSSSPSPEPRLHPLQNSHRSGSLDCLLQPTDLPQVKVSDEKYHRIRQRVNSLGDLLSGNNSGRSPTPSEWTPSCSPQPSPIHVPMPTEVTRLQNGYARVVHPDLSRITSSQSQ